MCGQEGTVDYMRGSTVLMLSACLVGTDVSCTVTGSSRRVEGAIELVGITRDEGADVRSTRVRNKITGVKHRSAQSNDRLHSRSQ